MPITHSQQQRLMMYSSAFLALACQHASSLQALSSPRRDPSPKEIWIGNVAASIEGVKDSAQTLAQELEQQQQPPTVPHCVLAILYHCELLAWVDEARFWRAIVALCQVFKSDSLETVRNELTKRLAELVARETNDLNVVQPIGVPGTRMSGEKSSDPKKLLKNEIFQGKKADAVVADFLKDYLDQHSTLQKVKETKPKIDRWLVVGGLASLYENLRLAIPQQEDLGSIFIDRLAGPLASYEAWIALLDHTWNTVYVPRLSEEVKPKERKDALSAWHDMKKPLIELETAVLSRIYTAAAQSLRNFVDSTATIMENQQRAFQEEVLSRAITILSGILTLEEKETSLKPLILTEARAPWAGSAGEGLLLRVATDLIAPLFGSAGTGMPETLTRDTDKWRKLVAAVGKEPKHDVLPAILLGFNRNLAHLYAADESAMRYAEARLMGMSAEHENRSYIDINVDWMAIDQPQSGLESHGAGGGGT
jgi:hypothetical protein